MKTQAFIFLIMLIGLLTVTGCRPSVNIDWTETPVVNHSQDISSPTSNIPSISGGQSHSDTRQSSELPLRIVSLTSPVSPGLNATLVVETLPGAECSAIVDYGPSGNGVLHPRMADGTGRVSWTWTVGRFSGTWQISITAGYEGKSKMIMTPFTVH